MTTTSDWLPGRRSTDRQHELFETRQVSHATSRNLAGDFFEEATAAVTGGRRLKVDSSKPWCPDVALPGDKLLCESKGCGRSNQALLFHRRLEKDLQYVAEHDVTLTYWLWSHSYRVTDASSRRELQDGLMQSIRAVYVAPLPWLQEYCRTAKLEVINNGVRSEEIYGCRSVGYGHGFKVKIKDVAAAAKHWTVLSRLRVGDGVLDKLVAYFIDPCDKQYLQAQEDNDGSNRQPGRLFGDAWDEDGDHDDVH